MRDKKEFGKVGMGKNLKKIENNRIYDELNGTSATRSLAI